MEDYVDSCYFVSKFKSAYEGWMEPIPDKSMWPQVQLEFKLWPPVLKRAAGRPRSRRKKKQLLRVAAGKEGDARDVVS